MEHNERSVTNVPIVIGAGLDGCHTRPFNSHRVVGLAFDIQRTNYTNVTYLPHTPHAMHVVWVCSTRAIGVATVCLALIAGRGLVRVTALELGVGFVTGLAVALANGLQAIGLQYIPSSMSAFLTALYVPMVPIAQLLFMREMPKPMAWLGILFAFAGMALLAGPGASRVHILICVGRPRFHLFRRMCRDCRLHQQAMQPPLQRRLEPCARRAARR